MWSIPFHKAIKILQIEYIWDSWYMYMYDSYSIYLEASVAGYINKCAIYIHRNTTSDPRIRLHIMIHYWILINKYIYIYITENGCTECTENIAASTAVPKNIFVYYCFCEYYFMCIFATATSIFKIISQDLKVYCHYVFSMKLVAWVTDRIYFLPDAFCCSHGGLAKKRAHESREGSGGKVFCDQYPFIKRSKSCR